MKGGIKGLFKMDNALIKRHGHVQKQQRRRRRRRVDFYYFIISQCIGPTTGGKESEGSQIEARERES